MAGVDEGVDLGCEKVNHLRAGGNRVERDLRDTRKEEHIDTCFALPEGIQARAA